MSDFDPSQMFTSMNTNPDATEVIALIIPKGPYAREYQLVEFATGKRLYGIDYDTRDIESIRTARHALLQFKNDCAYRILPQISMGIPDNESERK